MSLYYVHSFELEWMNCSSYVAHKQVLSLVPIFLLPVGTFGNLVSFYVLLHQAFRAQSVYTYLAVLGLADTAVLYIGLLPTWLDNLIGYRPAEDVTWICKMTSFGHLTLSQFSVWLIVAVTVERYLATTRVISALATYTKSKAKIIIAAIFLLLVLLNSHVLYTVTVVTAMENPNSTDDVMTICDSKEEYNFLYNTVWPWVDTCFYSLMPFIIIVMLNTVMVISVRKSTYQRHSLTRGEEKSKRDGGDRKLTLMLLSVSFFFIFTTVPINLVWIAKMFLIKMDLTTCQLCTFKLCHTIAEMLMYTNHSVNFFLYLFSGRKFRQYFADSFCPVAVRARKIVLTSKKGSLLSQTYAESKI